MDGEVTKKAQGKLADAWMKGMFEAVGLDSRTLGIGPLTDEHWLERAVRAADMCIRMNTQRFEPAVRIGQRPYLGHLLFGEESTRSILEEMGEKEEPMRTLNEKKIKRVTIECADGTTYTGEITRIEGCPFDYTSMTVEARIGAPTGNYGIERVIFANPSTIVYWTDGTKTVVTCMDNVVEVVRKDKNGEKITTKKPQKCDSYSKEVGLAMCIAKKHFGNKGNYNDIFRKFINEEDK